MLLVLAISMSSIEFYDTECCSESSSKTCNVSNNLVIKNYIVGILFKSRGHFETKNDNGRSFRCRFFMSTVVLISQAHTQKEYARG